MDICDFISVTFIWHIESLGTYFWYIGNIRTDIFLQCTVFEQLLIDQVWQHYSACCADFCCLLSASIFISKWNTEQFVAARTAFTMSEFETWLNNQLRLLNTDEGVFGAYIIGILEGEEESKEEKIEALEGILSETGVSSNNIQRLTPRDI